MTIEALLQEQIVINREILAILKNGTPVANDVPTQPAVNNDNVAPGAEQFSTQPAAQQSAPAKRGRGRPAKGETPAEQPVQQPVVEDAASFLSLDEPTPATRTVSQQEVRAALAVYKTANGQQKALDLFKQVSGVETLTKLPADKYAVVFKAALPADKLTQQDVRAVLVAAQARTSSDKALAVLKAAGADQIGQLPEAKFADVINAADQLK
jgi:hypothetical protein